MNTNWSDPMLVKRVFCLAGVFLWAMTAAVGAEVKAKDAKSTLEKPPPSLEDLLGEGPGIHWYTDFAEASAAARKAKRPLMVDFDAEWCGWCKKLDRETYGNEKVIRFVRQFLVAARIDADKNPKLKQRFSVSGLPTILFLSAEGEELGRILGFRPPQPFLEEANKVVKASSALDELRAEAEKNPKNPDAQRAFARALAAAGNTDGALAVLRRAVQSSLGHAGLLLDLADTLLAAGDTGAAAKTYRQVLALAPDEPTGERRKAYAPLTILQIRARKYDTAIELSTRYLSEYPEAEGRLKAYLLRAYASATKRDAEAAIRDLRRVKKEDAQGALGLRASLILELVTPPEKEADAP